MGPELQGSSEVLKWVATLGVGGVLAWGMFMVSRRDWKEWKEKAEREREAAQLQIDALLLIVKENTASNVAVVKTVEANTRIVEMLYQQTFDDNAGRRQALRRPQFPQGT